MKRTLFAYSLIPMIGLGLFWGAHTASAHGIGSIGARGFMMSGKNATPEEIAERQQSMFEKEAMILGITVNEVKEAWASGKSMTQLMEEKGLDKTAVQERMKAAQLAELKTQLQALVTKSIITQAQADTRLATIQTQIKNGPTKKDRKKGHMDTMMM